MRPQVAATAAAAASNNTSMFGIARPINDRVVQVGGANAGSTIKQHRHYVGQVVTLVHVGGRGVSNWRIDPNQ